MKSCRSCGNTYEGAKCPDCVSGRADGNAIPTVPTTCMVSGCGADVSGVNTGVNSVTMRGPSGQLFTPASVARYTHQIGGKSYCNSGYEFIHHVTRCNPCFHREHGHDWRDEMIAAEMLKHPEYRSADYGDPVDRADVFEMARTVSSRSRLRVTHRDPAVLADESILTGKIVTPEVVEKVDVAKYRRNHETI